MKTTPVTTADLTRSVLAVPPLRAPRTSRSIAPPTAG